MKKRRILIQKTVSLLSGSLLVLQSLFPSLSAIYSTQIFAQDANPTVTETPAPTPVTTPDPTQTEVTTPTPTTEVTPTLEPTPTVIPTITEAPTPTEEVTPTIEPTTTPPDTTPTEEPKNNSPPADDSQGQILDGASTTAEEQICDPQGNIRTTTDYDWSINDFNRTAETRHPVELGVKYVFPGNTNVSVSFTCLPKDLDKRTPLKIQELNISELKLPEGTNPATNYAYDITTGMADGTFKYDVTLPKPENKAAEVVYMETNDSETQTVSENNTSQEGDKIKANGLDHFTIFFVSTTLSVYASFNGVSQVTVYPSAPITATLAVTTSGSGTTNDWSSSQYLIEGGAWSTCDSSPNFTSGGTNTDTLNITAPSVVGTYDLSFRVFNSNTCTGAAGTFAETVLTDAITVSTIATVPITETFGSSNNSTVANWYENNPSEIISGGGDDSPISGQFAKIGDNGWICRPFDSTGVANVQLNYDWKGDSKSESSDDGIVEYKAGGSCDDSSGWTNLITHPLNNNVWSNQAHIFTGNSVFNIRFRTNSNQTDEFFRVDNISLSVALLPELTATKTNDVNGNATINQPFTWKIQVKNTGDATATFSNGKEILTDERPSTGVSSYGSPTVTAGGGASGTISCSQSGTDNRDLLCTANGTVTIPVNGYFDISFTVTPDDTGSLTNPRSSHNCDVDGGSNVSEKDENNNSCSNSVTVSAVQSVTNPTLSQSCGLDIALVIDNSNSIDSTELSQMKTAMTGFVTALSGTPTEFSVTKFGTNASVVQAFTTNAADVTSAISGIGTGGGGTDWEQAIATARGTFDPRTSKPNLMIFSSDGNPTFPHCGGSSTCQADVDAAVAEANITKNYPIRILALGIGNDLNVNNLKAISGPTVGTNLNADVITTDFSTLAAALATFTSETCGGTITVNKYIGSVDPANRAGTGYTFTVGGTTGVTTDSNGQTSAVPVTTGSGKTVVETGLPSGYTYASASCKNQAGLPVGSSITNGVGSITIGSSDVISCDFVNTENYTPTTICHATGATNHWVEETPATLGQLQGHVGTSHQNGNDIIPIIPVFLPSGQNWDATGQAIWNNHCVLPPTTGSISGMKFSDLNNDHIKSGGEPGLEGWIINLIKDDYGFATTNTDANGNYTFADVPLGTYLVCEAFQFGWAQTYPTADTFCPAGRGYEVTITGGENFTGKDFGNFKLGTAKVKKVMVGGTDTFNFSGNVSGNITYDGGMVWTYELLPGTYTSTETAKSGWDLTSIDCDDANSTGDVNLRKATFNIEGGETVICTFTNTLKQTDVTVSKTDNPDPVNNGGTLTYTLTATNLSSDVAAQNVIVTDTLPGGFTPSSVTQSQGSCSDQTLPNPIQCELGTLAPLASATVTVVGTFTVPVGVPAFYNDVTITTDTPETNTGNNSDTEETTINHTGTLRIVKNTVGGDDTFGFTATGSCILPPFGPPECIGTLGTPILRTITTNGGTNSEDIPVTEGQYTVQETTIPPGWSLTGSQCADPTSGKVTVTPGQTTTCTFTNSKLPTLTLNKIVDNKGTLGDADPSLWFLGITGVASGRGPTLGPITVNAGENYIISETPGGPGLEDYSASDWTCDNDITPTNHETYAVVNLPFGKDITCSITNTLDTGTLRVQKTVNVPDDLADWEFKLDNGSWIHASDTGLVDFGAVTTGNHTITEKTQTGYYLHSVTGCTPIVTNNNSATAAVTVGQQTTCTFNNYAIPVYTGSNNCPENAPVKKLVNTYTIGGTDADGEVLSGLAAGNYLFEATNTFVSSSGGGWKSDAAYSSNNNWSSIDTNYGIHGVAPNYGAHALLADLGSGVGIVDWGSYNSGHEYSLYRASPANPQFVIGDRWSNWYGTTWDNQGGMSDNNGSLTLNVYECQNYGSISGRKWEDINGNHIWDEGEPVVDGTVTPLKIFVDVDNNGTYNNPPDYYATIDNLGRYSFGMLTPGTYNICEKDDELTGWMRTYPEASNCQQVIVTAGQDSIANFGNFELGSIQGRKFNDLNNNGQEDSGEPVINSWPIRLYNASWNLTAPEQTTHFISGYGNGRFRFENLHMGTYYICEVLQSGWTQTDPGNTEGYLNQSGAPDEAHRCRKAVINQSGQKIEGKLFGNIHLGTITVNKATNPVEDPQSFDFTIKKDETTVDTFSLADLDAPHTGSYEGGHYSITEDPNSDWAQGNISCTGGTNLETHLGGTSFDLAAGESVNCTFNNEKYATVHVTKFNDINDNGEKDTDEPYLPEWSMTLTNHDPEVTNENGIATFTGVLAGSYIVGEELEPLWKQTHISCSTAQPTPTPTRGDDLVGFNLIEKIHAQEVPEGSERISLNPGETVNCLIGNHYSPPVLELSKENDTAGGDESPGASILYTLTLHVLDNNISHVNLIDLLPQGFIYRAGSWTASITGGSFDHSIGEPTYASPGTWNLGDLTEGSEITLTLIADVSNDEKPGLYKDLALAYGCQTDEPCSVVYATAVAPGDIGETNHVGTDVNIVKDQQDGKTVNVETTKEGSVLGASTELPATGGNALWILIASLFILTGVGSLAIGCRLSRRYHA